MEASNSSGSSKIIYLDQCILSQYAKCLCGYKKFIMFNDVCNKIDFETDRKIWLIPTNTIQLIEISKYEQTLDKLGNPKEVNSKILALIKKSGMQMVDLHTALEYEIFNNLIGAPIESRRFFRYYEGVPTPLGFMHIEVKNASASASENDITLYKEMLIDFINTYAYDMIYNSDNSKLKKACIDAGINLDKLTALESSYENIRKLIKTLFSTTEELEKRKSLFLKCKENKGRTAAEKLFTLEAFCYLYLIITAPQRKAPNGMHIPNEIFFDDDILYSFSLKNSSFSIYKELLLNLYSNKNGRIDKNDLKDIHFLSVAVPYCDIVITERKWSNVLIDKGLDKKFNTIIGSDLNLLLKE